MRKPVLIAVGFIGLVASVSAQATCAGTVTALSFLQGGPAQHVTVKDNATCAQVGPTGVTFGQTSTIYSAAPDSTGFMVSPGAVGSDTILINAAQYTGTQLSVTVALPHLGTLGVTAP